MVKIQIKRQNARKPKVFGGAEKLKVFRAHSNSHSGHSSISIIKTARKFLLNYSIAPVRMPDKFLGIAFFHHFNLLAAFLAFRGIIPKRSAKFRIAFRAENKPCLSRFLFNFQIRNRNHIKYYHIKYLILFQFGYRTIFV